ncbi:MAG: hypothetical protein ACI89D_002718, partial [Bermanella sp.]
DFTSWAKPGAQLKAKSAARVIRFIETPNRCDYVIGLKEEESGFR